MNTEELRDLLHANADGPRPVNPARTNQINRRIKRRKIRMAATAGLAAASVAVAITGVWAGLPGGSTTTEGPLTHGSTTAKEPRPYNPDTDDHPITDVRTVDKGDRFTAKDGTVYRRVSITSLAWPQQGAVDVPVTRGDKPLVALIQCNGKSNVTVDLYFPNGKNTDSLTMGRTCQTGPDLIELSSLEKGQQITLSLKAGDIARGGGLPTGSATFTTSIYEWTPPAKPNKAPKAPTWEPGVWQLLKSKSGVWPKTEMLTVTVPYRGIPLYFGMQCTGAIGDRAAIDSTLNGNPVRFESSVCDAASDNMHGFSLLEVPKGAEQVTVTVRLTGLDAAYYNRTSSWAIGLFEMKE